MRPPSNKIKDNVYANLEPYNITAYDKVFILLNNNNEIYKNRVHFNKEKQRYFLSGKIIEWQTLNSNGQVINSYPKYTSIAFIAEEDIKAFHNLNVKEKEKLIINVFYRDIDFITLDFNSFDWKK